MHDTSVTVFLFTDIEGSTRLWEQSPESMHEALARHDAIARESVLGHHGRVVKTTGDGIHAAFADALDAVQAAIAMQRALADSTATAGIPLRVRCGLHAGQELERDQDFYGTAVNRAARVMSAAHGGQILVTAAVASLVRARLPEDVSVRELGTVRLRDLARPEVVSQVVHADLRSDFPPLRSLAATPHNLPQPLTSFVGRERELGEVRALLASTRLLTLLGIGGLGKSRLSLELARNVLDEYVDGVWFVELAAVSDPRLLVHAVASVLGVTEAAGQPLAEVLRRFVADRSMLVLLDNCEHLAHACAALARELLESAPGLRIVATSRERLNIRGEQAYQVAPLAVPAHEAADADAVAGYAAARLFVERVKAVRPAFALTRDNAATVADVCVRLDGIPLALELAAARAATLPVDAIAARLSDRFRLLRHGDRTALPRQQTLRALIDWSYDLLEPHERLLFRRLSVFAGGFTLDAAEAVGTGEPLAGEDVVDHLTRLVEKSLVVLDAAGDRYSMLETVRQYAEEALGAADERAATGDRHLAYYASLGESARQALTGPAQASWLAQLDRELENILAALRWSERTDRDAVTGLQLLAALKFYWIKRGLLDLGHRLTSDALVRTRASAADLARCRALLAAGQLALALGRHDAAMTHLCEGLDIARKLESKAAVSALLPALATADIGLGDVAGARGLLAESLSLARDSGNRRAIVAALHELAQLERLEGRSDNALAGHTEALAIARELDDRESIAIVLLGLSTLALATGDPARAGDCLREVHAIVGELGSLTLAHTHFDVTAALAAYAGFQMRSARLIGAAERIAAATGMHRHPADEPLLDELVSQGSAKVTAQSWQAARAEGRGMDFPQAMQEAAACLLELQRVAPG